MAEARIIDFSLQVQVDFQRPRIKSDADPIDVARKVTETFGEFLDVQDVAFVSSDDLFGYSLTMPMFKGAGDLTVNPQNVVIAFRTGRNRQALKLIVDTICKIHGIAVRGAVRQNLVSATAVATFPEGAAYQEFMKRYVNPEKGVTAGGVVIFASGGSIQGECRLAIEKALGFENSLFISSHIGTPEPIQLEFFDKFGQRLAELLETQGLKLELPE